MAVNSQLRINVLVSTGAARKEIAALQKQLRLLGGGSGAGGGAGRNRTLINGLTEGEFRAATRREARAMLKRATARAKAEAKTVKDAARANAKLVTQAQQAEAKLATLDRQKARRMLRSAATLEKARLDGIKKAKRVLEIQKKQEITHQRALERLQAQEQRQLEIHNRRIAAEKKRALAEETRILRNRERLELERVANIRRAGDAGVTGRQLRQSSGGLGRGALFREALFPKIEGLTEEGAKLKSTLGRIGAASRIAGAGISNLGDRAIKAGRSMQWLGRQVEFRVTLPLLILGGIATKLFLDFDRAFTRFAKVLGDTPDGDLERYKDFFFELSAAIGKSAEDVANSAGIFAQAGLQGDALVGATIQAGRLSILTGQELTTSAESLIGIQKAWKFSTEELGQAINVLNAIENKENVSIQDLITGFQKAGNVAIDAGIGFGELAGFITTLVRATGTAEEAGNGLKTMFIRLGALTPQARETIETLLKTRAAMDEFELSSGVEQFRILSQAMDGIADTQTLDVLRDIFNIRQTNRASQIVRDLRNELDETGESAQSIIERVEDLLDLSQNRNFGNIPMLDQLASDEIQKFLKSDSQQFSIAVNRIKIDLIKLGAVIAPVFVKIIEIVGFLIGKFVNMDEGLRNNILKWTAIIALAVSAVSIFGALVIMIGSVIKALMALFSIFALIGSFSGALVIFAVIALIIGNFGALQEAAVATANVMAAVWRGIVNIISSAADAIVSILNGLVSVFSSFFSIFGGGGGGGGSGGGSVSLNTNFMASGGMIPGFASGTNMVPIRKVGGGFKTPGATAVVGEGNPSFPEFVIPTDPKFRGRANMLTNDLLGSLGRATPGLAAGDILFGTKLQKKLDVAGNRLQIFLDATVDIRAELSLGEFDQSRAGLAQVAPEVLPDFDRLLKTLTKLRTEADRFGPVIRAQIAVVNQWEVALESLENQLDDANDTLKELNDQARALSDQISTEQDTIQRLASTPLAGTAAAEDAIFANTQAQRELRLELLRLEQAELAIEGVVNEMDALNDVLDSLRDNAAALREEITISEEALSTFSNAPIVGMGAMEDAIFDNELAQKALRLEMLRIEEAQGPIEDTKDALAALSGDIEKLRARRTDLRLAGAGQDILGVLDTQIGELDAARNALMSQSGTNDSSQLDALQTQLDALAQQGQILELEASIEFDPLKRQIDELLNSAPELSFDSIINGIMLEQSRLVVLESELAAVEAQIVSQEGLIEAAQDRAGAENEAADAIQRQMDQLRVAGEIMQLEFDIEFAPLERAIDALVNGSEEMSFDAIVAGIIDAQGNIAILQPQLDEVNALIEAQEAIIAGIEEERQGIIDSLEAEQAILDGLNDDYAAIKDRIDEMVDALRGFNQLLDVGSGGGGGGFGPEGDLFDPTGALDSLSKDFDLTMEEIRKAIENGFGFDEGALDEKFANIEHRWEKIKARITAIKDAVKSFFENPIVQGIAAVVVALAGLGTAMSILGFSTVGGSAVLTGLAGVFIALAATPVLVVLAIAALVAGFVLLWQNSETFRNIVTGAMDAVMVAIQATIDFFVALGVSIAEISTTTAQLFMEAWNGIVEFFTDIWDRVMTVFQPVIDFYTAFIGMFVDLVTGDLSGAFENFVDTFEAVWDLIMALATLFIEGFRMAFVDPYLRMAEVILAIWDGIIGNWGAAWDGVKAVLSAFGNWIKNNWQAVLEGVGQVIGVLWDIYLLPWKLAWEGLKLIIEGVVIWAQTWWANAWEDVSALVGAVWDGISATWSATFGGIRGVLQGTVDWVRTTFVDTFTNAAALIENAFNNVSNGFALIFGPFGAGRNMLEGMKNWVKDTFGAAFTEVSAAIGGAFDNVGGAFTTAFSGVAGVLRGVFNIIRTPVNAFLRAVDAIPGVGLSARIPALAGGGIIGLAAGGQIPLTSVGSGFQVAVPTAIVGEGAGSHSEFVIPTDPKFRARALSLFAGLGQQLGVNGFASGGIVSPAAQVGVPGRRFGLGTIGDIAGGVLDAGSAAASFVGDQVIDRMIDAAVAVVKAGVNRLGTGGGLFDPKSPVLRGIDQTANFFKGRGSNSAMNSIVQGIIDDHFTPETFLPPTETFQNFGGNSILSANGGVFRATRGGIRATLAEAGQDELVTPLPSGFDVDNLGGTTININGDLSFPNITNGADANEFIANLEALVGRK